MSAHDAQEPNDTELKIAKTCALLFVAGGLLAFISLAQSQFHVFWFAILTLGVAFLVWAGSIVRGSTPSNHSSKKLYSLAIALCGSLPVVIASAIAFKEANGPSAVGQYIAIVGAVSLTLVAVYGGMLQSSVTGWRRDTLSLALVCVTIIGAIFTGIGAIRAV